jgi:hypothetical protein
MVHKWTQFHPDFAHDLRPQVQGLAGVPPCLKWERWPPLSTYLVEMATLLCHVFMLSFLDALASFRKDLNVTSTPVYLEYPGKSASLRWHLTSHHFPWLYCCFISLAGLLARADEYLVDIDILRLGDGVDDSVGDILAL